MRSNNHFDPSSPFRPYTHSTPATPGSLPPDNALRGDAPELRPGFWPCERDGAWRQVEDHRGRQGWLDGAPHTIEALGPLPEGFSDTRPQVPLQEALEDARARLLARRRQAEYGGFLLRGVHWDSAEKDELRLHSAIARLEATGPEANGPEATGPEATGPDATGKTAIRNWKINPDTVIDLTLPIALDAARAMLDHFGECFAVEEAKRTALEIAIEDEGGATEDDVRAWLAANLEHGWPGPGR